MAEAPTSASNLNDHDLWTVYKLVRLRAIRNLEEEVAKPHASIYVLPWECFHRLQGYMQTAMLLIYVFPTNEHEDLIRRARFRWVDLMWRLDYNGQWDDPIVRAHVWGEDRRRFGDRIGLRQLL